jgi:exodeoxyribonuclease VII large subunit
MAMAAGEIRHSLALRRERLDGLAARLESLSPMATLARGFAIVRLEETETLVHSVTQVSPGDRLSVCVADGAFGAQVEE